MGWVAWKTLDEAIILKCNPQWQAPYSIKDDESEISTLAMLGRMRGKRISISVAFDWVLWLRV